MALQVDWRQWVLHGVTVSWFVMASCWRSRPGFEDALSSQTLPDNARVQTNLDVLAMTSQKPKDIIDPDAAPALGVVTLVWLKTGDDLQLLDFVGLSREIALRVHFAHEM